MKKKPSVKKAETPVKIRENSNKSLLDRLESFCERNKSALLFVAILLSIAGAVLQFNYKVSEANDDSMYLEGASKFSKDFFGFYTANAPFYPMFLSLIIRAFGFKLVLLKLTGIVFLLVNIFFLYKAFEKRLPYFIVFFIVFLSGISNHMLYYASMTFTEQFFLMQQSIFFFFFFRAYDKISEKSSWFQHFLNWLPVGLVLFILSMSRNLGVLIIVPVTVFFLFDKKWMQPVYFIASFAIFRIPFELIKKMYWGETDQFSNQINLLIRQKDPYDASKGVEDFSGFIDRFTGNYSLYISKRFYQILGFLSDSDPLSRPGLGFIFFVVASIAVVFILLRKNKHMLFTLLYTGALICATFLAMQTRWDQLRLILVFVPLIFAIILFGYYEIFKNKNSFSQGLFLLFPSIIFISVLFSSIKKSLANYPVLAHNLQGDKYYGYTPDWKNYLLMSEWCADSLPLNSLVACRKAPMSFIYGKGKEFYPIYQVFSTDPDTVLSVFKRDKVTHVMLASLRRNPKTNDGYIINTVHRIMQPLSEKYPTKLRLIKQIGESEPAYLYQIIY